MAGRAAASSRPATTSRSRNSVVDDAGSATTSSSASTARRAIQLPPLVRLARSWLTVSASTGMQRFFQARPRDNLSFALMSDYVRVRRSDQRGDGDAVLGG